jgi:hypothetical protein
MTNALPLSNVTTYTGFESTHTWDEDMVFGCVCDSSWTVGLGSGEVRAGGARRRLLISNSLIENVN